MMKRVFSEEERAYASQRMKEYWWKRKGQGLEEMKEVV